MDDLKSKAAPKYELLAKEFSNNTEVLERIKELSNNQIVLLDRLCTLKEEQQENDNKFRDDWGSAKRNDTKVGLWVLVLANVALYLDVIKIDSNGAIVNSLLEFIK